MATILIDFPVVVGDSDSVKFGDAEDITMAWDGTDFDVLQLTANSSFKWGIDGAGMDQVWYGDTASVNVTWDQSADSMIFNDNAKVVFGTGSDVTIAWDATDLDVLAVADDYVIKFGNGTNNFDIWFFGNIATSYFATDASADLVYFNGPMRPQGFHRLAPRYELRWIAGERGKPALNAVIATDENSNAAAHLARNLADRQFEVLGVNMTTALVTFNVEGGITMTTAGADGDEGILVPHLDTNQSAWATVTWGTDQQTEWECEIKTGANITNAIIWAGLKLTNTEVLTTDADQVFFRYEDDVNSGKWVAVDSIANADTSTDSNVTVAVSTKYHLRINIDSSRVARMYINGVLVRTTSALTNTTDLIPYIGVAADGASAAKALSIYGQTISRVGA